MGKRTTISWTDATWNPWVGCRRVSAGCDHCYMFDGQERFGQDPTVVRRTSRTTFTLPLRMKEPWKVFSWGVTQLVLSLFPGLGLLDMAFEEEGFTVVRGPDRLWGGDVRRFHPPAGRFDGVIGGPPCQAFSTLANLVRAQGREPRFGNLIPDFARCVAEAEPQWFLMENVRGAPVPWVPGYGIREFLLDNTWLGQEQKRLRRFTFGLRGRVGVDLRRWIEYAALELPDVKGGVYNNTPEAKGRDAAVRVQHGAVTSSDGGGGVRTARYSIEEMCRLQGLPEDFLRDTPFTMEGKRAAVANGVPLFMGRAVARAVKRALEAP